MKEISITINRATVYEEVSQTTSYTGSKQMDNDAKAYERIMATDADKGQLQRFWDESRVDLCQRLKKYLKNETMSGENLTLTLEVSGSYDDTLTGSVQREMFSYFVTNIIAKWYVFANKPDTSEYAVSALNMLDGINRKLCYKKRPTRTS